MRRARGAALPRHCAALCQWRTYCSCRAYARVERQVQSCAWDGAGCRQRPACGPAAHRRSSSVARFYTLNLAQQPCGCLIRLVCERASQIRAGTAHSEQTRSATTRNLRHPHRHPVSVGALVGAFHRLVLQRVCRRRAPTAGWPGAECPGSSHSVRGSPPAQAARVRAAPSRHAARCLLQVCCPPSLSGAFVLYGWTNV